LRPGDPLVASGEVAIPQVPGCPPPQEHFYTAYRDLARETRDTIPALVDPHALDLVPQMPLAASVFLASPITAEEVARVLFPMPAHSLRDMEPCHSGCRVCAALSDHAAAYLADPHAATLPIPRPAMHTNTAVCEGDVPPEVLRWPSTGNPQFDGALRLQCAQVAAAWMSGTLASRDVPRGGAGDGDGEVALTIVPLAKSPPLGQVMQHGNPSNYRGITLMPTDLKLLATVLLQRLSHVVESHGLLSPVQIGFRQVYGAEMHVLAVQELIRARWRQRQPVYAVFMDIKKAYDSVHLPTLFRLLTHMGVPEPVVSLLRRWTARSRARVRVNGILSPPFPVDKGLPQGNPLSPLLFNLYLEALLRMLLARSDIRGVTVNGVTVKVLAYADDIVLLCESPEQAQLALDAVCAWLADWGLDPGIGNGKTEAVAFIPGATQPAVLPPLRVLGTQLHVAWEERYKYLGVVLRWDLKEQDTLDRMRRGVMGAIARLFQCSPVVRALPVSDQLRLVRGHVLAGAMYR